MKVKTLIFVIIINLIFFVSLEISIKFILNYLGYPSHQTYANIDTHRYNYLTGYYKESFEKDFVRENGTLGLGSDQYGFSLDGDAKKDRDLTFKNKCTFRTFIFGGSTVEGRHLVNKYDTLSSRLEKKLENKFENTNIEFEVINTGVSSFNSSQELALYLYKVLYAFKPDHVIFFNGSNDFTISLNNVREDLRNSHIFQRKFEENFKKSSRNIFYYTDTMLAENLSTYFLFKKVVQKTIKKVSSKKNVNIDLNDAAMQHVNRYFYNINLIALTASYNNNVTVFFQPTLLPEMKNNLSIEETEYLKSMQKLKWNNYPYLDAKQKYYNLIRNEILLFKEKEEIKNNKNFQIVDISKIFLNKNKDKKYFSDHVHYLPNSRSELVKSMEYYLIPNITNSIQNRYKECL